MENQTDYGYQSLGYSFEAWFMQSYAALLWTGDQCNCNIHPECMFLYDFAPLYILYYIYFVLPVLVNVTKTVQLLDHSVTAIAMVNIVSGAQKG